MLSSDLHLRMMAYMYSLFTCVNTEHIHTERNIYDILSNLRRMHFAPDTIYIYLQFIVPCMMTTFWDKLTLSVVTLWIWYYHIIWAIKINRNPEYIVMGYYYNHIKL